MEKEENWQSANFADDFAFINCRSFFFFFLASTQPSSTDALGARSFVLVLVSSVHLSQTIQAAVLPFPFPFPLP